MMDIVRYPPTLHLAGSKGSAEGVPVETLTGGEIVVEEKIDGTEVFLFFDDGRMNIGSHGALVTDHPDFFGVHQWMAERDTELYDVLGDGLVVFGEWCERKHTVFYDRLPDLFVSFDIYDRHQGSFLAIDERLAIIDQLPMAHVPILLRVPSVATSDLVSLFQASHYKSEDWRGALEQLALQRGMDVDSVFSETDLSDFPEGLYVKHERSGSVIGWYKFIRSGFVDTIRKSGSHWKERRVIPNLLATMNIIV